MPRSASRLALVLSGGGARGAYEAGALRFILGELPLQMGVPVLPNIICGTSVGAINGAWTAAHLGAAAGAHQLSEFWRSVTLDQVYRFVALDILRSPMRIFRAGTDDARALLDASPLHALIRSRFPEARLRSVVASGKLDALVITATETQRGQSVHFVDGSRAQELVTSNTGQLHIQAEITAEHLLASCAIPLIFPSIQIDGRGLVDGSLRQNTPLKPALSLGATHCLVIGTKMVQRAPPALEDGHEDEDEPTVPFLLGKTLNALLLDPVHADIKHLELVNQILRAGRQNYGEDFAIRMNTVLRAPLREIEVLYLRPSRDLGRVAAEVWDPTEIQANRATRMLLSTIAERAVDGEADLLSYLLFDRNFSSAIEQLGYDDAAKRGTEIAAFLTDAATGSGR